MGIEPTLSAWEAEVLPLNYTRLMLTDILCFLLARSTNQHKLIKKARFLVFFILREYCMCNY